MHNPTKAQYSIQHNILRTNLNNQKIKFPFYKTTILAKKKINPKNSFRKESTKYQGVGTASQNWFNYISGCSSSSLNGTNCRKAIMKTNEYILFDTNFLTEKKLYWFKKEQKKLWWSVFSYHNFRRKKGLPLRGQRTKTNATTAKKLKVL